MKFKLENYIKDRFIHTKSANPIRFIYYFFHKYLKKTSKKTYTKTGLDLLISHFFRNQSSGIYIDIGCYHPTHGSNTYLLHQKGWLGINLDLDDVSIEYFNRSRKNSYNKKIALSDKKGFINLYRPHQKSAGQSVDQFTVSRMKQEDLEIIKIECDTLNNIIDQSPFADRQIDFISIDVEGHEITILKEFNFERYRPRLIALEFNDPELKRIDFEFNSIDSLLKSDLHLLLSSKNYHFVNWTNNDVVYISNDEYSKREVIK